MGKEVALCVISQSFCSVLATIGFFLTSFPLATGQEPVFLPPHSDKNLMALIKISPSYFLISPGAQIYQDGISQELLPAPVEFV